MPVSASDLTKFRDSRTHTINPTINIIPPTVVATATVAVSPSAYPIGEISVSGTSAGWGNIEVGHLYRIHDASGNFVTTGIVRKTPTASILYIDGKSQGDSGIATQTRYIIQATDTVTVHDIKPMWTLLSRIKDGVFYKKFDIPYDGSGSNPAPVVNMGNHRSVWAGSSTTYNIALDGSDSFAWRNRTIASYTWTFPVSAGYAIASGTVNDASLSVDFNQGYHRVKLTIVDSAGQSSSSMRHIWVNGDSYDDLSRTYGVEIGSDSQNRQAQNMSVTLYGDFDESDFIEGSMVVIGTNPKYDGDTVDTEYLHDTFVGFAGNIKMTYDAGVTGNKSVSFDIKSPFTWFGEIPMVSQVIVEVASPSSWEEVIYGLGTTDFLVWYIVYHHTTFFEQFGYYPTGDGTSSPRKIAWGLTGSSVAQYLEEIASFIGGNIGCVSNGDIVFRRDPNIENNTYRDTLDNVITWTPDDIAGEMEIEYSYLQNVSSVSVYALERSSSTEEAVPFGSIAPGFQQGQASGSEQYDSFVLKPGENQTRVNELSGHLYAKANPKISDIGIEVVRNVDIFEPALMVWHTVDIPATYSSRNERTFYRCLVNSVTRNWEMVEFGTWVINISVSLIPETFGQPGIKIPINQGGAVGYTPASNAVYPSPFYNNTDSNIMSQYTSGGFALATDNEGNIAITKNIANWEKVNGLATGFQYVAIDWNPSRSTLISNGWANGKLAMWAVGIVEPDPDTGVGVVIYYTPDILTDSDPVWLALYSESMTNPIKVNIATSKVNTDDVLVVVNDSRGTYAITSNDAGENWSTFRIGIEQDLMGTTSENAPIACLASEITGSYATFGWNGSGYNLYVSSTDLTDSGDWSEAVNTNYNFTRPANWMAYSETSLNEMYFSVMDNQETNPKSNGYRIPSTYGFILEGALNSSFDMYTFNGFPDNETLTISGIAPYKIGNGFIDVSQTVLLTDQYFDTSISPSFTSGDETYGFPVSGTIGLNVSNGSGGTDATNWYTYFDNSGLIHGDTYYAGFNVDFLEHPLIVTEVNYRFSYVDPDWSNPAFPNVATTHRIELQDMDLNTIDYYEVTYDGTSTISPTASEINTSNKSSIGVTRSVDWINNPVRGVRRVVIYITSTGDGTGFFPRLAMATINNQIGSSLGDTAFWKMDDYPLLIKGKITQTQMTMTLEDKYEIIDITPRGVEGYYNPNGTIKDVSGSYITSNYGIATDGNTGGYRLTTGDGFFNDDTEGNLRAFYEFPDHMIESVEWDTSVSKIDGGGYIPASLCDKSTPGTFFNSAPQSFRIVGGDTFWFDINFASDVIFGDLETPHWAILNDASCAGWSRSDAIITVTLYDGDNTLLDLIEYDFNINSSYNAYLTKVATPSDTRIITNATFDWKTQKLRVRRVRISINNTSSNSVLFGGIVTRVSPYETLDNYDVPVLYRVDNYDIPSSEYTYDITPIIDYSNPTSYSDQNTATSVNPHGFSVDSTNRQRIKAITTDAQQEEYWYMQTGDKGSSWGSENLNSITILGNVTDETIDYNLMRGIIQAGLIGFVWGIDTIGYFVDGDIANTRSMRGDWNSKISPTTTEWKQMMVIV